MCPVFVNAPPCCEQSPCQVHKRQVPRRKLGSTQNDYKHLCLISLGFTGHDRPRVRFVTVLNVINAVYFINKIAADHYNIDVRIHLCIIISCIPYIYIEQSFFLYI